MQSKEQIQENNITWEPLDWYEEEKISMPEKIVILTAAPGATIAKEQNPHLPITPEDIVKNHYEAYKAGASIIHIHVRDEKGHPTGDPELFKRVVLEVKEKCPDAIIDFSFAYPFSDDSVEARLEPFCKMNLPIELGTISAGTMNIMGKWIYVNREDYLKAAVKYLQEHKIRPTITVYNVKQIVEMKKWAMKTGLVKKPYLNLSLGLFGDPARNDVLQTWLKYLPEECDWVAETAGRNWLPTTIQAILSGGHIMRAGMEDGIYMYPHRDDLIKTSADAVTKVKRIAEELGLEIATPSEAREILGLS